MKKLMLDAVASVYEEQDFSKLGHPYLTYAKFVFTDDQPNKNNQGVKYEDFPLLAKSAIDMPVKLRFLGRTIGDHKASVPIGHIKDIEEVNDNGVNQLVATAALYSEEFPNEVKYLKDNHAAGKSPVVSWELGYEKDEVENGVTWKRRPIAKASTFVRDGAYGTRTALLALASLDVSDEQLGKELKALAETTYDDGGKTVTDQEYEAKIKDLETKIADLTTKFSTTDTALKTAEASLQAKDDVIQQYEKVITAEDRTRKIAEAGLKVETDPEKLKVKQEFWASLPEETFTQYLADLKMAVDSAAPKKTAFASLQARSAAVPRLEAHESAPANLADLAARLKGISRGTIVNE